MAPTTGAQIATLLKRAGTVSGLAVVVAALVALPVIAARRSLDAFWLAAFVAAGCGALLIELVRPWLRRLRRFEVYTLAAIQEKERLSWNTEELPLQNLAWVLRAKHQESALRARREARLGLTITVVALLVSLAGVAGIGIGWHTLNGYVLFDSKGASIPDRLWELALATSAAILLVGGAAALLFKVAMFAYTRKATHEKEADFTRQIEVAVRLAVASATTSIAQNADVARALRDLAVQLVHRPQTEADDESPSLEIESAAEHGMKQVADVAKNVANAIKPEK